MKTVMIAGASRGIGLACVKQYAEQGFQVIATCRDLGKSTELRQLAEQFSNISVKRLDIAEESQVKKLAEEIKANIDILIINAGVGSSERTLSETGADEILRLFKTNALGHFLVAKYFVAHVAKSALKQIVSLSSRMGSIEDNTSGGAYAYRASKAADNAMMRSLALDTQSLGVHVMIFHPGWVKTDLTRGAGNLTPAESVERLVKQIENARAYESGVFLSHDGSVLPW